MPTLPTMPEKADCQPVGDPAAISPILRRCMECPTQFPVRTKGPGQHARFCSPKCRKAFNARNSAQGGPVMPLLKAWRLSRNTKGRRELGAAALNELVSIIDDFISQDRLDGRTSEMMLDYARGQLRNGRYVDRRRRR